MSTLSYQHVFEPGRDPAAAPLLLLHGTGGDEHDLLPVGRQLAPGAALLSPRGDVLERGAPRFFRRFAEGVFDLADVERRTHALADFIAAAAQHYGFDASRLTALGFSNGANIAASLLLLRPESLAAAVLLRPMVVLEPAAVPSLAGKRVLISSGNVDPIVPPDHPTRLAAQLRHAGADVTLRTHAASHGLVPGDFAATKEFLAS
ncbi:alpha/beta hydrolase [Oleiharenicola sp. Vm1]|uniref:alpha/beta hydrolase n=1 Tax=Oleiharenicola sp. Vm1 TaxID=3398393 RepID=UPI0039F4DDA7